jgi:hypothetical protein
LANLKISKACGNIYRRIFLGGVIAWHGRNDLRDTTGLPFANLTRIDIPVRSNVDSEPACRQRQQVSGSCCGHSCQSLSILPELERGMVGAGAI